MIVPVPLAILLLGAAAALGLGRRLPTRLVGFAAAAVCWLAAGLLLVGPHPNAPVLPWTLFTLGELALSAAPNLAAPERAIAVALLGSAGLALLTLSAAVAMSVREFGAIFGWALLAVAGALLSLAAPAGSLLLPLAWAVATIGCYAALRASGALSRSEALPQGLVLGLLGSALLLGALTGIGPALGAGEQPGGGFAALALAGALAVGGLAPFFGARGEAVAAPAPLGALVHAVVMPTLAVGALLRYAPALPVVPGSWAAVGAVAGAAGALAAGARAAGARRLRATLAWLSAGQASAALAAASLGDGAALAGAHALLISTMLAGVAGAAAVSALERSSGSDDYTAAEPGPRLPVAGAIWALAAAAALGLPPLLGFWGRRWLLEGALAVAPWSVPFLLAGSVLAALAALAPLARFWAPPRPDLATGMPGRAPVAAGGLALLALLALGVAPQLSWALWLDAIPLAPPQLPASPGEQAGAALAGALAVLLALLAARRPSARSLPADPDELPVRLAPDALADGLRPLGALGGPEGLLRAVWGGLAWLSELLRTAMLVFEQRFYLLGVLMMLLVMMLLMAR